MKVKGHIKHADLLLKLIFDFAKTYMMKLSTNVQCKFNKLQHKLPLTNTNWSGISRKSAARKSGKLFKY